MIPVLGCARCFLTRHLACPIDCRRLNQSEGCRLVDATARRMCQRTLGNRQVIILKRILIILKIESLSYGKAAMSIDYRLSVSSSLILPLAAISLSRDSLYRVFNQLADWGLVDIQRSAKVFVRGCEKFVLALAYLYCPVLPGSCLARFAYFLADLCTWWRGGIIKLA